MAKPKAATPEEYIVQLGEDRRAAIKAIHGMIKKALPKLKPSIQYGMIGYGTYTIQSAGGREAEGPIIALASQSSYISVYGCGAESLTDLKRQLPKANCGKGCLRFKKCEDIDLKVLEKIVKTAAAGKQKSVSAAAGK